jgi:hypothetical protein
MLLAISSDRKAYEKYWEWHRNKDETTWWKEFRWKELKKKVAAFEKKIQMPHETIEEMTSLRDKLYKYYSQSVHLAPIASIASNYTSNLTDGTLKPKLLLGASRASRKILEDFTLASVHFLTMQRACM